MAKKYRAAVIGCGGMSPAHIGGYLNTGKCEVVAVVDIDDERAAAMAEKFNVAQTFRDYRKMLKEVQPELVSVVVWTPLHAKIVRAVARSGAKAIHCEKPIAPTWGESRAMVRACERAGVQLTFNHQRRFLEPFRIAKELANDGTIGDVLRFEASCPNLFDWGTHWFDMFFFFNNDEPAEWVIGQIDARETRSVFGVPVESQGLSYFKFKNGRRAMLVTGHDSFIGAAHRILGTHGAVEIYSEKPHVRYRGRRRMTWREVKTKDGIHGMHAVHRAIADLVEALEKGREPELSARRALQATEIIFATYESSRRRGRVDLPLKISDSPLLTMLESGELEQKKPARSRRRKKS